MAYYQEVEDEQKPDYRSQPNFKKMISIAVVMAIVFLVGFILAVLHKTDPLVYEVIYITPVVLAVIFYKRQKRKRKAI